MSENRIPWPFPASDEHKAATAPAPTSQPADLDLTSDKPLESCPVPGNGDACESCQ